MASEARTNEKIEKLRRVAGLLKAAYGRQRKKKTLNPLDQLILDLLAENSSERRARQGFKRLKTDFVDWNETRVSSLNEIESAISMVAQAPAKAALVKKILVEIFTGHHRVALDFLREATDAVAGRYLGHFEGLGKKTIANCVRVLKQGISGPTFEVARVLRRLNLIKSSLNHEEIKELLCEALPVRRRDHFCRLVKAHAQRVCTLKGFACGSCALLVECPTGKFRTNHLKG